MPLLTVHYHELALKRGNRSRFARTLRNNLQRAFKDLGGCRISLVANRFLLETDAPAEQALERAARTAGVAYVLRVERLPLDLAAAGAAVLAELEGREVKSFRISAKRVDKSYPKTSVEVDREVGAIVHEATGIPVRLKGAEFDAQLVVLADGILVGCDRHEGPGGLPSGTGGRVAVLMSGGIDSPVAAWRLMKRGCRADLIHFHSHPLVDRTTQEKARDLAELLNPWQFQTRLHLVPLAEIQKEVRLHCPEAMRVVLYRRFMMRIAERIARRRRCGGLVTGESLGQVASQTLENLATVGAATDMAVLRPLVGMDKLEIIRTAEYLGTFEVSIRPDQDCCRIFVPAHPATKTTPAEAELAEQPLDVLALVEDALARTETVDFSA